LKVELRLREKKEMFHAGALGRREKIRENLLSPNLPCFVTIAWKSGKLNQGKKTAYCY